MTLLKHLQEFSRKILTSNDSDINIEKHDLDDFKGKCLVILPAGGEGTRARALTSNQEINKAVFSIEGGQSLIERTICMYRDAGVKNFLCLTYYRSKSVRQQLGDGSSLDVTVNYSEDPGYAAGRGGAILNALDNGLIKKEHTGIVHNPDDIIITSEQRFPDSLLINHLKGMENDAKATVVVVSHTPYAYTGMSIENSFVSEINMYPMIPVPAHVGVTVLSSNSWKFFEDSIERGKKIDFETNILPKLAQEGKLYAYVIPYDSWYPVNDLKGARRLKARLSQ